MKTAMKIKMVKISDLHTDISYQRELDTSRTAETVKAFSLGAMKAISVSQRSCGQMFVYDGQHTVEVARACGMTSVPAVIVPGDKRREAQWFLLINGAGAKRVPQRGIQKAGVIAGDEMSGKAQEVLDTYEIEVSSGGLRAGRTNAIGAIKRYIGQSPANLKVAMDAIHQLWRDDPCAWSGVLLRGMVDVAKIDGLMPQVVAACRKKKLTPRRIMDVASAMQTAAGATGGGAAHARAAILKLSGVKLAAEVIAI
ncbi:DUF6551 family protein [Janthinobacterium sp. UMAB-56]|uniref:DUF6551 family protein n=1 Tax=Janthinobacterium sp. UMAB-56 TaxID=1365361 RepID=UPI001C564605|nr:DUF6551 family protein [Janthinobacterium sp. UMAB-56]